VLAPRRILIAGVLALCRNTAATISSPASSRSNLSTFLHYQGTGIDSHALQNYDHRLSTVYQVFFFHFFYYPPIFIAWFPSLTFTAAFSRTADAELGGRWFEGGHDLADTRTRVGMCVYVLDVFYRH
jgi:hypothetical protein